VCGDVSQGLLNNPVCRHFNCRRQGWQLIRGFKGDPRSIHLVICRRMLANRGYQSQLIQRQRPQIVNQAADINNRGLGLGFELKE
jgi:hypothetical protein